MVGRPVLTTPPTSEPISLTLVKEYLRFDAGDTSQDTYLNLAISVARETAEKHTTRGYMTQSYREYYDSFPGHHILHSLIFSDFGYDQGGLGPHRRHRRHHEHFELSRSPLQAIKQIQYIDLTGATQTLDPAQYVVNNRQDPAEVTRTPALLGGVPWPHAIREPNSVWIDYNVGYGGEITVSMTASSAVIGGHTFLPTEAGYPIFIPGAGVDGAPLKTTVLSVDSGGVGTAANTAGTAVTGMIAYLGNKILHGDTQAMLLLIGHWDANRLPIQQGIPKEIDYAVKYLLDKDRVYYQP